MIPKQPLTPLFHHNPLNTTQIGLLFASNIDFCRVPFCKVPYVQLSPRKFIRGGTCRVEREALKGALERRFNSCQEMAQLLALALASFLQKASKHLEFGIQPFPYCSFI